MIYLHVPFEQKDDAKSMGAKWDSEKKLWYAPDESFKQLIEKYSALVPKNKSIKNEIIINLKDFFLQLYFTNINNNGAKISDLFKKIIPVKI